VWAVIKGTKGMGAAGYAALFGWHGCVVVVVVWRAWHSYCARRVLCSSGRCQCRCYLMVLLLLASWA
jgi:hypothetical protein